MTQFSNIEIVNFEDFENEDNHSIDFEHEIGLHYLSNFINSEKFECEDSENFRKEINLNDSSCNTSIFSENQNLKKNNLNLDSSSISLFADQTNCSENMKNLSVTNDSFCIDEKIQNNSFTFIKKTTKFKINAENNFNQIEKEINKKNRSFMSDKNFPCEYEGCIKSYKSKENLNLHVRNIHLNEKPYSCEFCDSLFSHRNGKTYHERKFHTNVLPYKCEDEFCFLSFASKSALSYHVNSKHSSKKTRKYNRKNLSKFNEKIIEFNYYPEANEE